MGSIRVSGVDGLRVFSGRFFPKKVGRLSCPIEKDHSTGILWPSMGDFWYNLAAFMVELDSWEMPPTPKIVYAQEPFSGDAPYAVTVDPEALHNMWNSEFGMNRWLSATAVVVLDFNAIEDVGPSIIYPADPDETRTFLIRWNGADEEFLQHVNREVVSDLLAVGGGLAVRHQEELLNRAQASAKRRKWWIIGGAAALFATPAVQGNVIDSETLGLIEIYGSIFGGAAAYLGNRLAVRWRRNSAEVQTEMIRGMMVPTADRLAAWSHVVTINKRSRV